MKKLAAFLFAITALIYSAAALPGVNRKLNDFSGEYVYYKDYSFKSNSYVGFIYYNDSTYAVRFYSASVEDEGEKDITLYFTVDPSKKNLEFTGERITGNVGKNDTDIVNYMHDMFYELTARRQKAGAVNAENITLTQEYEQFGGKVNITFSPAVPVFNVLSITAVDRTTLLEVQTTGILVSDKDQSFASFKGVEMLPKDKNRSGSIKAKAQKNEVKFEGQTAALDQNWTQMMENFWVLGNNALISMNTIQVPESYKNNEDLFMIFLQRKLTQSTEGSYLLWKHMNVESKKGYLKVSGVYYEPATGNVKQDFKIVSKKSDGSWGFFDMTVFQTTYSGNRKYFDAIVKSYR